MAASFDIFLRFFYVAIGLILISAFVGLFTDGIHFEGGMFLANIGQILESLASPGELSVIGPNGKEYTIFLQFWNHYFYSLVIFLSAFLLALALGILLAYLTTFLPEKRFNAVSKTLSLLE